MASPAVPKLRTKLKTRRGYGRKNSNWKPTNLTFRVIGSNSAGLNPKRGSLFNLINNLKPSIITIQETKLMHYRTIKIPGYEVFEHLREDRNGDGLLTAALLELFVKYIVKIPKIHIQHLGIFTMYSMKIRDFSASQC